MTIKTMSVKIKNPEANYQVIIGQANFSIFTTDDLFKTMLTTVPGIKCAVAMNEAVPKLTRVTANNSELEKLAAENALAIGASHVFVIMMEKAFPINVLPHVKNHPAVCSIFVASANVMEVVVAETELGKAVIGVVDGTAVDKIETPEQKKERREATEKIGYKIP
ncbi:MAG: adenosine-specific kinase [Candidatus Heimdallarchaeota archaeon]|nr:adenosine-specific kinase [Candidatus Heimdallarchaeota archaeon]MBY8995610.1 adenosine-specific kinase [Candidatus Heimdallarchaeota archaeon]